ncbi:MAG: hypothetical protein ACM3SY_12155, partial [Candidatus Omnitrophota bacterium]
YLHPGPLPNLTNFSILNWGNSPIPPTEVIPINPILPKITLFHFVNIEIKSQTQYNLKLIPFLYKFGKIKNDRCS